MGGYLSILLLLSLGLSIPPGASSCPGTIHFLSPDGENLTVVENAPLTLRVRVSSTCHKPVHNLRVALSKRQEGGGPYIDVCSVFQQNGKHSDPRSSKNGWSCTAEAMTDGLYKYKFQTTAKLVHTGQWRVKTQQDVTAVGYISFVVQEASRATPTIKMEETTVTTGEDEEATIASEGSTKADNSHDRDADDPEEKRVTEEGSTQPLIVSPDRNLSEEMIHPFFNSFFGYGTLGMLGLALVFIFIVTIVCITRKGKCEKSPKKGKPRRKQRQPSDVMSIQSSDVSASVLYDDIVLGSHAAEEAHLRAQRPLPPVPLPDYLTPVASESELPPVSHQHVFHAGHYFNIN